MIEEQSRVSVEHDAPLSNLGVSQAHVTGKWLKEYLRGGQYQRVVIESSPFLRTLETAAAIASEVGVGEITVNYRLFDWLREESFPLGCPFEGMLFVNTKDVEQEREFCAEKLGYPDLKLVHDRSYEENLHDSFPEEHKQFNKRVLSYIEDVTKSYSSDVECKTAHIVVTHSANILTFVHKRVYGKQRVVYVKPKKFINYCGVAAGTIYGANFRMTHDGSSNQLCNWAAENHLMARLEGNPSLRHAVLAVQNAQFDRKFKKFAEKWFKEMT